MIFNCWRRILFVCELPTAGQLGSNRSLRPSEEVLDRLCHSLFVDLSKTGWAQTGLINEQSKNTFCTVTRIRLWKSSARHKIRPWKPTVKRWCYIWYSASIYLAHYGQCKLKYYISYRAQDKCPDEMNCSIITSITTQTSLACFILCFFTGWNDNIDALEKTTWFHFRLMKTGFLFCCRASTCWPVVYQSQER